MKKDKKEKEKRVKAKADTKNKTENKDDLDLQSSLPQNILPMGEYVNQGKNIYILQSTYKEIHKFTKNKTTNESGGVLVGKIVEELGKVNILIYGFIEAKYSEATPTTLTFTHESWEYIHEQTEKKFSDGKIIGWIHTHPDFGIFLSEYDTFIHENFFSEENQIAYVIDPIQHIEGFYFWDNSSLVRCKGFYIFDKTGKKIEISNEAENKEEPAKSSPFMAVMVTILSFIVVILMVISFIQHSEIKKLQEVVDNNSKVLQQMQNNLYNQFFNNGNITILPKQQESTGTSQTENQETVDENTQNQDTANQDAELE